MFPVVLHQDPMTNFLCYNRAIEDGKAQPYSSVGIVTKSRPLLLLLFGNVAFFIGVASLPTLLNPKAIYNRLPPSVPCHIRFLYMGGATFKRFDQMEEVQNKAHNFHR